MKKLFLYAYLFLAGFSVLAADRPHVFLSRHLFLLNIGQYLNCPSTLAPTDPGSFRLLDLDYSEASAQALLERVSQPDIQSKFAQGAPISVYVHLLDHEGRLLMTEQQSQNGTLLASPGGDLLKGEGVFQGAQRKALEQAGVEIGGLKFLGLTQENSKIIGRTYLVFHVMATIKGTQRFVGPWQWVDVSRPSKPIFDHTRSILDLGWKPALWSHVIYDQPARLARDLDDIDRFLLTGDLSSQSLIRAASQFAKSPKAAYTLRHRQAYESVLDHLDLVRHMLNQITGSPKASTVFEKGVKAGEYEFLRTNLFGRHVIRITKPSTGFVWQIGVQNEGDFSIQGNGVRILGYYHLSTTGNLQDLRDALAATHSLFPAPER